MSIAAAIASFILYALFQARHIPSGDSGDLLTAAATFGVAHPPGYPLYTLSAWLLRFVPVSTFVWRSGLLSSIPHALVLLYVYSIVFSLTKNRFSSGIAALMLLGNYLFFLYSVTPEVFALLDLFVAAICWHVLSFLQHRKTRDIIAVSFLFALSLTHHQLVLFLLPAVVVAFWPFRLRVISLWKPVAVSTVAGLLPYLYVYFAARGISIVNWDTAVDIPHFIQLITRADYGTFQSGAFFGTLPVQRLLQLKALAEFLWMDIGGIGLALVFAGFFALRARSKRIGLFLLSGALCIGPVFLLYASFPLTNRFTLATFERFLLPTYVFAAIAAGVGHAALLQRAAGYPNGPAGMKKFFVLALLSVPALYFCLNGLTTIRRFQGYAADRTAENLARDILSPLPPQSVLLLNRDTPLFTTQYLRYGMDVRPDVIAVHANKLGTAEYRATLSALFPALTLPEATGAAFVKEFMRSNARNRRVFSNARIELENGWYWVPYGLVFELTPKDRLPAIADMMRRNIDLWNGYQDPGQGVLKTYNHMMLSDVRDVYTSLRKEFGKTLLRAGEFSTAKNQFTAAIAYGGDSDLAESYAQRGLSELFLKECGNALSDFQSARITAIVPDKNLVAYEAMTYRDCVGDRAKSDALFEQYKKTIQSDQILLQSL